MVLDPIPQSLPVHFFGSRPQPPTSPHITHIIRLIYDSYTTHIYINSRMSRVTHITRLIYETHITRTTHLTDTMSHVPMRLILFVCVIVAIMRLFVCVIVVCVRWVYVWYVTWVVCVMSTHITHMTVTHTKIRLRCREVGGWGRVPFSRNLMSPTPSRKWYLTTGRRAH